MHKTVELGTDGVRVYPAGYSRLAQTNAEFQQLWAEQLVTRRDRNGFPIREWRKRRERNKSLDGFVYARAAAAVGLDRIEVRHWCELEASLQGNRIAHTDRDAGNAPGQHRRM